MNDIFSLILSIILPLLTFFGISFSTPEISIPENVPNIEAAAQNAINEFTQTLFNGEETTEESQVSEGADNSP